jgi:hypothetical protein
LASPAAAHIAAAHLWVLADSPSRFFYQAMGGIRIGERDERLWGAAVHEVAYGWPDLGALAQGLPSRRRLTALAPREFFRPERICS